MPNLWVVNFRKTLQPVVTSLCNVTFLKESPARIRMKETQIHGLFCSPLLQNLGKEVPIQQCIDLACTTQE